MLTDKYELLIKLWPFRRNPIQLTAEHKKTKQKTIEKTITKSHIDRNQGISQNRRITFTLLFCGAALLLLSLLRFGWKSINHPINQSIMDFGYITRLLREDRLSRTKAPHANCERFTIKWFNERAQIGDHVCSVSLLRLLIQRSNQAEMSAKQQCCFVLYCCCDHYFQIALKWLSRARRKYLQCLQTH